MTGFPVSDSLPLRTTGTGRIVFDAFRSAYDPMLDSWLIFRAQMVPELTRTLPRVPSEIADERERARAGRFGVWRILASNNRELGRGTGLFPTPTEAVVAVTALQREATELEPSVVRGVVPMTHGWVLRRGDHAVMTSSRWYESGSEAATAALAVRDVLATASVVTGVSIGTQSGRRHRRELAPVDPRA